MIEEKYNRWGLVYKINKYGHTGYFAFQGNKERIQQDIANAANRTGYIQEEYKKKDFYGNYLRENDPSRKFLNSTWFKSTGLTTEDFLKNLKDAEFLKIDIDKDKISKREYNDIIYNGIYPEKDIPLVYIFKSHYYENDKDITMYLKIGFDSYRSKDNKIKDVFIIKSLHLESSVHGDKSLMLRNNKDCLDREAEKFKFINDNKYLLEHEIDLERLKYEIDSSDYPKNSERKR